MSVDSSPRPPTATWNPARGAWETGLTSLFCEHSELYSRTWPASGSMRNGSAYQRPPWALRTSATASSSSRGLPTPRARGWKTGGKDGLDEALKLLPTPTSSEHTGPGHAAQGGMNLRTTVSLLPTPTVADSRNTANFRPDGTPYGAGYGQTLVDATRLLPTPVAADSARQSTTYSRGNPTLVGALLPTPRASDGAKGGPNQRGSAGDLTLPSAAHRIGASTVRRSAAGSTSPDGLLPGQLTIEDASTPPSSSG